MGFAKSPYNCNPKFWMKLFPFVESIKDVGFRYLHLLHVIPLVNVMKSILLLPKVDSNQLRELQSFF